MTITNIWIERFYPLAIGLLVLVAQFYFKFDFTSDTTVIYQSAISMFTVIFGFLLTAFTIIKSYENHRIILFLKKRKIYDQFMAYLHRAIWLSFWISAIALALLIIPKDKQSNTIVYIFISLTVYGLLASHRFLRLFFSIITSK